MTLQKLHWLIALEIGLILISFKAGWFGVDQIGLDEHLRQWLASEAERELTKREWIIGLAALVFFPFVIFSWIWLWMLKPYSRIFYTLSVAIGFAFYPLGGPYVSNGFLEIVDGLTTVISGMILGVLYFTHIYPKTKPAEQDVAPQSTTRSVV